MMRVWILWLLLLGLAPAADAATYYVRTDGNNACAGTTNAGGSSGACAWRTIDFAASNTTVAGDVVRVQAGSYTEVVSPTRNGSSGAGNTITFVADGSVTVCGAAFSVNSYQRWIGFRWSGSAAMCGSRRTRVIVLSGVNHHMEFWNNTIGDGEDGISTCCGDVTVAADQVNDSLFIGNNFDGNHLGNLPSGGSSAFVPFGSDVLIGHNEFSDWWCDVMNPSGARMWILNNYVHDMIDGDPDGAGSLNSCHSDFIQFSTNSTLGFSQILFEGNFQKGNFNQAYAGTCNGAEGEDPGCNEHTTLIQITQPERCNGGTAAGCDPVAYIAPRRNVVTNIGSGAWGMSIASGVLMTHFYHLNNTDYRLSQGQTDGNGNAGLSIFDTDDVDFVFIRQNIEVESWTKQITGSETRIVYTADVATTRELDRNLAFDTDHAEDSGTPSWGSLWTGQANELTQKDPDFTNAAGLDFTLQSTSPARNAGSALCQTTNSGTGTTFTVATRCGGWFRGAIADLSQYGGELARGDSICVGSDVVEIASISGDSITTTASFTWASGENVFPWGQCSASDLGAFPYKAGGYTLTGTYSVAGGTVSVTTADTSLVRYMVVFENGIPVCADGVAPFSCGTVGAGALTVRLYKRFASTAPLWADATNVDESTELRLRLR